MHGQQTLKHLNDTAVAAATLAKHKNIQEIDPKFEQAVKERLEANKKSISE